MNHTEIRPEYPRPDLRRKDWICLNGQWDFTVDNTLCGEQKGYPRAESFNLKITVPFCPESRLSGLEIKEFMSGVWYTRVFTVPSEWRNTGRRTFLNIGACDYETKVYINGNEAGTHRGGYTPFSFEITEFLQSGENRVTIFARDDTRSGIPRGKQSPEYEPHGCVYTRTTGIWQSVWLENTPARYIKNVKMTPCIADCELRVEIKTSAGGMLKTTVFFEGEICGEDQRKIAWNNASYSVSLSELHLWELENPRCYDIFFTFEEDCCESYFGMRELSFENGKTYLNEQPIFQRLILDQGYYPDGIYTAPSDDAMVADIKNGLAMGFNGARLHQKVFDPRYLYHADRLGYLLWGEYPNWDVEMQEDCYRYIAPEWLEVLQRDYNHPALIGWCPLNETHRPYDAAFSRYLYALTKAYDPTRLFIDNSGWIHIKGAYDMFDVHDYCPDPAEFKTKYDALLSGEPIEYMNGMENEAFVFEKSREICFVSEFGGAYWTMPNANGGWGYGENPQSAEEFLERFKGLVDALLDHPKICAFCYTQLTDVEQEKNGLYTYDRIAKFSPQRIKEIVSRSAAMERE